MIVFWIWNELAQKHFKKYFTVIWPFFPKIKEYLYHSKREVFIPFTFPIFPNSNTSLLKLSHVSILGAATSKFLVCDIRFFKETERSYKIFEFMQLNRPLQNWYVLDSIIFFVSVCYDFSFFNFFGFGTETQPSPTPPKLPANIRDISLFSFVTVSTSVLPPKYKVSIRFISCEPTTVFPRGLELFWLGEE